MVMDPKDPNVIYAGTGEGVYNTDALRGAGVFRTIDGMNWQRIEETNRQDFLYVNRMAISNDGERLLAVTKGPDDNTPGGIYLSVDAHRTNWKKTFDGNFVDVDFDPTDKLKAVASCLNEGRAYYSVDGGETWKPADQNGTGKWTGRLELTYGHGPHHYIYASVDVNQGEIWRSQDGGQHYIRMKNQTHNGLSTNYLGQQGWYDNVI